MISMHAPKPGILIVDDHLIFRQALKSLLTLGNIATVIGDASNGKEFIGLLSYLKPDLVLMDIDMPCMNGLEATQKALELMPDLKIIAITMFGDDEYNYRMIDLGVKGFILKTSGISELEKAIHDVMVGESYFPNEILKKIINSARYKNTHKTSWKAGFTEREMEVLQQICLGLTTAEISNKLCVSLASVRNHRSNLLAKTACKNTPGLILFVVRNKIISL